MKTRVFTSVTCPTCCQPAGDPFRSRDAQGNIVAGCVDHFHTGHLVTPSASSFWHARPDAKRVRAADKAMRGGCVTVRAERVAS